MRCLAFLLLVTVCGCVHIHEDSGIASKEQIQAHLAAQLHCQRLDLREEGRNHFSGTGRNDTGEFTLHVTREGRTISFHGAYLEPGRGTFSGSAAWTKNVNSALGFDSSTESSHASMGSP